MTSTEPFVGALIGAGWEEARTLGEDRAFVVRIRLDGPVPWPMQAVWQAWPVTVSPAEASSPTPDGVIKERGEDDADLNARLKAAGMYSIPEMMGVTPLTRWTVQAGMTDLDAFAAWLDRRVNQFLRMKAGYELGDKDKGDELYEWVNAHSAALSEARENFRAVREAMAEAHTSTVPDPSSQESGVGETDFAALVQIDVGAMAICDQAASKISDERAGYQDGFHQGAISAAGRIRSLIRILMPDFDSRVAGLPAPRPSQREG